MPQLRTQMSRKAVGVSTGPVINPRADAWIRDTHLRYLAVRAPRTQASAMAGETNSEVWTNFANVLALQATDRALVPAPAANKKGFDAFPVTAQQMVLFASERSTTGAVREYPVDTYVEIRGLPNAAYVGQRLHYHLKTCLGLDVLLPSGFCSTLHMDSFIAASGDRPATFSIFACGPQPLTKPANAVTDEDTTDDLMRMQLKVVDSTTGLSEKDTKRLTLVKHSVPKDFRELAGLFDNFAGVTELIYSDAARLSRHC